MRGLYAALAGCAVAGCATAGKDTGSSNGTDSGIHVVDGTTGGSDSTVQLDAMIDAASGIDSSLMTTLTETPGGTMMYMASIACANSTDGTTRDNIWYRAYQLADYPMITGAFTISSINVSVQESKGTPTITVKVGSYAGTLDGTTINAAQITPLAMQAQAVPVSMDMLGENLNVPIAATIPAGGKFVVQVSAPDQNTIGYFYIGATAVSSAETHKGYVSSASCAGLGTPQPTTTVSTTAGHIIITVNGSY